MAATTNCWLRVVIALIIFSLRENVGIDGQQNSIFNPATGALISCDPDPCLNNGTCLPAPSNNGTKICKCPETHVGQFCQHQNFCFTGSKTQKRCFNGGTCETSFPNDSFRSRTAKPTWRCNCKVGFNASLCEIPIPNVCDQTPCHNGGTCQLVTLSTYTCACRLGYRGENCDAVDYCKPRPCKNGGLCNSTDSGFICTCPAGRRGVTCEDDVNECSSGNPCTNGGTCVNTMGSFRCSCIPGFTGHLCEAIFVPCQPNPCRNGGRCNTDRFDRYRTTCDCPTGFSGKYCQDNINDCAGNQCVNGATCVDGVNSYTCQCLSSFTGVYCQYDVDECNQGGSLCKNGGTCHNAAGGYECICANGWSGRHCDVNVDDCSPGLCLNGGKCVDRVGSYHCECPPGKTGLLCHLEDGCASNPCTGVGAECSTSVIDGSYVCTCPQGRNGTDCQLDINECEMGVGDPICGDHGVCRNTPGSFLCECNQGFAGSRCTTDLNECASNPCQNDGSCIDDPGGYRCFCMQGFNGTNCENNINECSARPCRNGGVCHDLINSFQCVCPIGFEGETCQITKRSCLVNPCKNHGSCIDGTDITEARCACAPGFQGRFCEENINECASSPCQFGSCIDGVGPGNFTCTCRAGYTGRLCQDEVNECIAKPCGEGTCVNLVGNYRCICPDGYSGAKCELKKSCRGGVCRLNTDNCYPGACFHGGTCVDKFDNYECRCPEEYTGPRCEHRSSARMPESCATNPCLNNGQCFNGPDGSATCRCPRGYGGSRCQHPYVNECNPNPCMGGGRCISDETTYRAGNFKCICPEGATGPTCQYERYSLLDNAGSGPTTVSPPRYFCPISGCAGKANNSICDKECNVIECDYDGKDCSLRIDPWVNCTLKVRSPCYAMFRNGRCDPECNIPECMFDGFDCGLPVSPCRDDVFCAANYGNGVCDEKCNTEGCDYDGLDCDQQIPKLVDGALVVILTVPPDRFRKNIVEFLRNLGKSLRSVPKIKKDDEGKDLIMPWKLSGGLAIDPNDPSIGSTGTAVYVELDNRKCSKDCFQTVDAAAAFLAASEQKGELNLGYPLYSVQAEQKQDPSYRPDNSSSAQLWWLVFVVGGILAVVIFGGLIHNKRKTRIRAVTWFPVGMESSSTWDKAKTFGSTAVLHDTHLAPKAFEKPTSSGYDNSRHSSDNFTVNSYCDSDNEPSSKRMRGSGGDEARQWTQQHFDVADASMFVLTPPSHDARGMEIDAKGPGGLTPLMLAAMRGEHGDSDEEYGGSGNDRDWGSVIHDLLLQGANIDEQSDEAGETALHMAARCGRPCAARTLLNNNADVNLKDHSGRTALHAAVAADSPVFWLLINNRKVEWNARTNDGTTPLILAIRLQVEEIVDELLKHDPDVNLSDEHGRTALHWAASVNNYQACKQLLHRQAKVDIQDEAAQTPLYLAAKEGSIECVKELLEFRANAEMPDDMDKLPRDIAMERRHMNIVQLLDNQKDVIHSPPQNFQKNLLYSHTMNLPTVNRYVLKHPGKKFCNTSESQKKGSRRRTPLDMPLGCQVADFTKHQQSTYDNAYVHYAHAPQMDLNFTAQDWKNPDLKHGYYGSAQNLANNKMFQANSAQMMQTLHMQQQRQQQQLHQQQLQQHAPPVGQGFNYAKYNTPPSVHSSNATPSPAMMVHNNDAYITSSPESPGQWSSSPASEWSDGIRSPQAAVTRLPGHNHHHPGHNNYHYISGNIVPDPNPMFL